MGGATCCQKETEHEANTNEVVPCDPEGEKCNELEVQFIEQLKELEIPNEAVRVERVLRAME